jgi:hypothetical protein
MSWISKTFSAIMKVSSPTWNRPGGWKDERMKKQRMGIKLHHEVLMH